MKEVGSLSKVHYSIGRSGMMGADDDAVIERVLFWKGKNRVLLYEAMTLVEVELRGLE